MPIIEPTTPTLQQKGQFFSYKSQTLNPESKHNDLPINDDDFRFLAITASRAKRKLHETSTTKYRISSSCSQRRQRSSLSFRPDQTISSMTRKRHQIEEKTKKLANFHGYLMQKVEERNRRMRQQSLRQDQLSKTISLNRSEKSLFSEAIKQNNESTFASKLKSKSMIEKHRVKMQQILEKTMREKYLAGQIGRNQSQAIQKQIQNLKKQWQMSNKQAFQRGKQQQQQIQRHRRERQQTKKRIAEQNYKNKWMQQFANKERTQRQSTIRYRKLQKKIQDLLTQTQLTPYDLTQNK